MENRKVGRPLDGKQKKKKVSISIEPWLQELIIAQYGSLSAGLGAIGIQWAKKEMESAQKAKKIPLRD